VLCAGNFLSPLLDDFYHKVSDYLAGELGRKLNFLPNLIPVDFEIKKIDLGFLCGLPYTKLKDAGAGLRPIAACVLHESRNQEEPIYFSDLIVHKDAGFKIFSDLEKCSFAFNEEGSHSGFNIVGSTLADKNLNWDFFGSKIKTGSHLSSIQAVLQGKADTAAIDSHVLALHMVQDGALFEKIHVLTRLGPSPMPALVAAESLGDAAIERIGLRLADLHRNKQFHALLQKVLISRFASVSDQTYNQIRAMSSKAEMAARL